jgi:hypothetical protein
MSPANDRLVSLFDAVLNQRADDDQVRQLDALLAEDTQVVQSYVLYSQQEVDLRHTLKTGCIHSSRRRDVVSPPMLCRTETRNVVSKSVRLITAFFGCTAALLMFAGLVHYLALPLDTPTQTNPAHTETVLTASEESLKPPAPVAVLAAVSDAVWQGPKLFLGQSLREGDAVTLVKGEARISMGFGAEIAAKGPCALRIVARDRVQLQFGEVAVHVAEWAHGFKVETPAMDVVDLGTTFIVSASRDASAETSVIEGQVRVSPRNKIEGNPRSVLVSRGEALAIGNTGDRLRVQPSTGDAGAYVDFAVQQPYRPIGLHNSGYGFVVGDEDPYWRVINGPHGAITGSKFAIVCVPDVRYMPNDPKSSQWVSMEGWREALPNSTYTFQTTFDLTGFDLATVRLFGRMLADNGINEVRVNGKPIIIESWVDNTPGQQFIQPQFRSVNVSEGLVEGTNTIEIDVWNGIMQPARRVNEPNPMALRVEWEGFGRPKFSAGTEKRGKKVTH